MKKGIYLLLLFCWVNNLWAQYDADFFQDTTQRVKVDLGLNFNYGSTSINTKFINKFIYGGRIDQELKDNAFGKLKNNNIIGGDLKYHLNVEIPMDTLFGKTNMSLLVGVENIEHADARFSDELFKFTFQGNKQFAGQTIDISNTNFNYYKYQQVNFGIINHKVKDNKLAREGVIVSLIKGQSHQAVIVPRGSLFTEELGKELVLDLNYVYNSTDTAKTGITAFNGYGISTDLFTEFFLKNGSKIHLGVEDLGFIRFSKQSIERSADSTFHFQGVQVDNLFDLNDSLLSDISKDGIIDNVEKSNKKGDYSIALPTAFNINYTTYFNKKWKANVGLYYKILSNYFPLIYVNTYYYFNNSLAVKGHVSIFGYGRLNLGLAVSKNIKNKINIFIGTNNIEAFVAPKSAYNTSAFVGIKAYF